MEWKGVVKVVDEEKKWDVMNAMNGNKSGCE